MNTYYYLFYSFIVYAFLGWILEVLYHIYTDKRFINRGFLHGPICPIYGISCVLFIVVLNSLQNNIFYLFIGGAVVASIIEYVTGYFLELFFHTKWWDYSNEKFNLKGYICLRFSVIWGALSIIFMRYVNPNVSNITYFIINRFGDGLYSLILILFVIDVTLTINNLIGFRKLFIELEEVLHETKDNMDKLMEKALNNEARLSIQNRINHLEDIRERLISRISLRHRGMLNAYPHLKSRRFNTALTEIKERFEKINLKR